MKTKVVLYTYQTTKNKGKKIGVICTLNSWQALIKPWDGFCGPLEVRTHPLPPPDLDCVMQDVKLQLLNLQWFRVLGVSFLRFKGLHFRVLSASFSRFWGLRFRSRVLRFRVLDALFLRFRSLRFRSKVLRFRDYLFRPLPALELP